MTHDEEDKVVQFRRKLETPGPPPLLPPGSGGGTYDDMGPRVTALEQAVQKMDAKLDKLVDAVASIRVDIGELKGRVASMPTIWQTIALVFTILGGAFLILRFGLPHGG